MMWSASNPRNPVTSDIEDAASFSDSTLESSSSSSSSSSSPLLPDASNETSSSFSVASFEGGGGGSGGFTFVIAQKKRHQKFSSKSEGNRKVDTCTGQLSALFKPLNNKEKETSEKIHLLFQASYKIEAELLNATNFPPLKRTVNDLIGSNNIFFAYSNL